MLSGLLAIAVGIAAYAALSAPAINRSKSALARAYGHLPLSFTPNHGQADPHARFIAQGVGYGLYFTAHGPVLALARQPKGHAPSTHPAAPAGQATLGMRFLGARQDPAIVGVSRLPGTVNSFIGNNHANWHAGIATFSRIRYQNPWPGISADFYGNQTQLEYTFQVAPGADPARVGLGLDGARGIRLDKSGALVISLRGGSVRERAPYAYQLIGGHPQLVQSRFVLRGQDRVGLSLGTYDHTRPLTIDPTLAYSTYLGGSSLDDGNAIAVDGAGDAYVIGQTISTDFPTHSPLQAANAGGQDTFVAKLNAAGSALSYSTYLGGSGNEVGYGIAVDSSGSAYITGDTNSTDFPTQSPLQPANAGGLDAFVAKLNPAGSALSYSTYLGGSATDHGLGIAIDTSGNAYVTGFTNSTNFPTHSPLQAANGGGQDAFVAKLNPAGSALSYSTYLGGSGNEQGQGIAVDSAGSAYLTGPTTSTNFPTQSPLQAANGGGQDTFVSKLNPAGSALSYSTYLGGSGNEFGQGIAVDSSGNAYLTGSTSSTNFPTQSPLQAANAGGNDAYVAKLNASGTALSYSTYLGGSGTDSGVGIAVDSAGSASVIGYTFSADFPTQSALQAANGGGSDVFVAKLNAAGSALTYSTYLGGSGTDGLVGGGIAVDSAGNAYLTGTTGSTNFPTQSPLQAASGGSYDAFVAKISSGTPRTLSVTPSGSGEGTVTSVPPGISCGASCSVQFADGTLVTLTATPAAGSSFTSWSGCDSTSGNQCTLTMNAVRSVSATFTTIPTHTLTISVTGTGSGTVSGTGVNCPGSCVQSYPDGTLITLIATPAAGSSFAGWSGDCVGSGPCALSMSADKGVTARFSAGTGGLGLPQTTITNATISKKKHQATFTFTATNSPAGFQCALQKPKKKSKKGKKPKLVFSACNSPTTYKHLKPGKYTFAVRAFNVAGTGPVASKPFKVKK